LELWPLGAAAVGHSSSGSDSDSDGCIPLLDLGRRRLYQPPDTVLYEAEANMVAPSPEALLQTVRACCLDPVVQRAFMQNPSVMTLLSQLHHHPGPLLPAAAAAAAAAPECGWGDENPRTARSQSDEAPWRLVRAPPQQALSSVDAGQLKALSPRARLPTSTTAGPELSGRRGTQGTLASRTAPDQHYQHSSGAVSLPLRTRGRPYRSLLLSSTRQRRARTFNLRYESPIILTHSHRVGWQLEEAVRELCAGVTHVAGSAVQTLVTAARHAWRFFHPPNPLLLEERVCVHLFATCDFGVLVDLEVTPAGAHSTRKPRTPAAPPHEEDTARVIEAVMALTVLVLSLVLMKRLR
jgi:hypothetical protein